MFAFTDYEYSVSAWGPGTAVLIRFEKRPNPVEKERRHVKNSHVFLKKEREHTHLLVLKKLL